MTRPSAAPPLFSGRHFRNGRQMAAPRCEQGAGPTAVWFHSVRSDVYRLSRNSFQNSVRRSGVKREKYYSRLFRSSERSRRVLDFLVYKHVTPRGVKHAAVSSSSSGSSDSYWAGLAEEDRT